MTFEPIAEIQNIETIILKNEKGEYETAFYVTRKYPLHSVIVWDNKVYQEPHKPLKEITTKDLMYYFNDDLTNQFIDTVKEFANAVINMITEKRYLDFT